MIGKCHQRVIREQEAAASPAPVPVTLDGFRVERISRADAERVILRYEWLGNMGRPTDQVGLISPEGDVHGVACFGVGPGSRSDMLCDTPESKPICLIRGACIHNAHPHAGSFLVRRATKLMHQTHGWNTFFAYSDPEAGEVGTIYQATGWLYLGRSPGRPSPDRLRYRHATTGEIVSTRAMRERRASLGLSSLKDLGPEWLREIAYGKGKYVMFEGSKTQKQRLRDRLRFPVKPYPKRAHK